MPRSAYIATARRSGGWWAIEVPGVPGVHSQAKRLDRVEAMAREATLVLDVPEDSLDVVLAPELDDEVSALLDDVARAKDQLRRAEQQAAAMLRMTAETLTHQCGLTTRDAGKVMGVSFQRISQLTSSDRTPDVIVHKTEAGRSETMFLQCKYHCIIRVSGTSGGSETSMPESRIESPPRNLNALPEPRLLEGVSLANVQVIWTGARR